MNFQFRINRDVVLEQILALKSMTEERHRTFFYGKEDGISSAREPLI